MKPQRRNDRTAVVWVVIFAALLLIGLARMIVSPPVPVPAYGAVEVVRG